MCLEGIVFFSLWGGVMVDDFIDYVGPSELHDAVIRRVETIQNTATVVVKAEDGHFFALHFSGVTYQKTQEPEGKSLYGLVEVQAIAPSRKFIFVDWEDGSARLEIISSGFDVTEVS